MEILPTAPVPAGVDPAQAAVLLESPPTVGRNGRQVIRALVTGVAAGNLLQLLSAEGNIALRSPTPIPIGSVIVLEIDAARRRAHILSVQSEILAGMLPDPVPAEVTEAAPALAARQGTVRAIVSTHTPDGVAHLETPDGKIAVRTAVPLPPGSIVVLDLAGGGKQAKILSIQLPLTGATVPETARFAVLVESPPALAGRTVTGIAIAHADDGTVTLKASEGAMVVVRTAVPIPIGSTVTLQLHAIEARATILTVQTVAQPGAAPALHPTHAAPERLLFGWPALNQTLSTLAQRDPLWAAIVIDAAVARPGRRLADAMLRWTEALSVGDGAVAFGPAAWGMIRESLGDDFQSVRSLTASNPEGWRGFPIPLHDGHKLGVLALMVRGEPPRTEDAAPQRIAVQFPLHTMGEVRIEALVRYRHLDVLVRSADLLPGTVVGQIESIFADAKRAFALGGGLNFKVGPLPLIILGPAFTPVHDVLTA
jgi:hypothetical protein